ncbi:MAG: N-(5'-phosphoribosyl)anthranilate isomerase, partial [Halioglobus sp.]
MARTRVKICGITTPDDALAAAEAGADAIGMVFYPDSPRCVSIPIAAEIAAVVPAFVTVVALFVDEPRES